MKVIEKFREIVVLTFGGFFNPWNKEIFIPDIRLIWKSLISLPLSQLQTLGKTTTTIVTTSPPDQSLENGQGLFVQSTKLSLSSNSSSATLSSKQKKK